MDEPELIAAYIGVLRHELSLPRGADALLELEVRLTPSDPNQRPPARAPGIARLAKALKRLRLHKTPAGSLEQFQQDLRFLRVFEDDTTAWSGAALDDLLANVITAPPSRAQRVGNPDPEDTPAPVIPIRPRRPQGDA
jgi:hypothetical protein